MWEEEGNQGDSTVGAGRRELPSDVGKTVDEQGLVWRLSDSGQN